jgi:hypothetical protein
MKYEVEEGLGVMVHFFYLQFESAIGIYIL